MIIADTNLILYPVVNGDFTAEAVRVLECDPNWYAPESWQPECINVLTTYCRNGLLSVTPRGRGFQSSESCGGTFTKNAIYRAGRSA